MKARFTHLMLAFVAAVPAFLVGSALARRMSESAEGALLREWVGTHAATLEEAEGNVQRSRRVVREALEKAAGQARDIDHDAADDTRELHVALQRFDDQMVKIGNLKSLYDRDVEDLRRLGAEHFAKWREKVAEIRDSGLRLDQEYAFASNRSKFDQQLARADEELSRLASAIERGRDIQRVAECLRLEREADKATRSLETLASQAAQTARVFLGETTTLVEMLASR